MTLTKRLKIAEAVIDYLADQTFGGEPILHAIIACDWVSRQRMIQALEPVIEKAVAKEGAA